MSMSGAELMMLIAKLKFEPFTDLDWESFAGCRSETPMIAWGEGDDEKCYIIDGGELVVVDPYEDLCEETRYYLEYVE